MRARQSHARAIAGVANAPAGAKAPAAATIAAAAKWPDFSDGNLEPDSTDDNLGPDSTDGNHGLWVQKTQKIKQQKSQISFLGPGEPWGALGGPGPWGPGPYIGKLPINCLNGGMLVFLPMIDHLIMGRCTSI